MFVWFFAVFIVFCGAQFAAAEVIQLKDKASISGTILSEKRDMVVVDLGYTVLTIPKNQIAKILKDSDEKPPTSKTKGKQPIPSPGDVTPEFYQSAKGLPEKAVRDLVQQLGEGVVQVRTPSGLGSGFILNEDGYLITNFHVIEGETQLSVEVYHQQNGQLERSTYKQIRIVAMNKFQDLALLKIDDKDAPQFSRVVLGDAENLAVGEGVFAIGSPLGLERTVTQGIVSTKTREFEGALYLQTTAQINPGNSGGPLFNLAGEVVGITNMKITFGEGLGFAIPIEGVKFFLDHRDAYTYANDNPSNPYRYLQPPGRTHHVTTFDE